MLHAEADVDHAAEEETMYTPARVLTLWGASPAAVVTLATQAMVTPGAKICEPHLHSLNCCRYLCPRRQQCCRCALIHVAVLHSDECEQTDPPVCPEHTTCTNVPGNYYCSACTFGYESGSPVIAVLDGFHFNGARCVNIDECLLTPYATLGFVVCRSTRLR